MDFQNMENSIQNYNNWKYIPYVPNVNFNGDDYYNLLNNILFKLNIRNLDEQHTLYYHGTNWRSAFSINRQIKAIRQQNASDFGKSDFYITDTLRTAYTWARRNKQPAIVMFIIPDNHISSIDDCIVMNHRRNLNEWKNFVYKIRTTPSEYNDFEIQEYEEFIVDIDSKKLIAGPIFANPGVNINEVDYIKYNNTVPYQYSFREESCRELNRYITITIFLKEQVR